MEENVQSSGSRKETSSFKKLVIWGVVLLVTLFLILPRFIFPLVTQIYKNTTAAEKVAEAKMAVEGSADEEFKNKVEALRDTGALGRQVGKIKVDVCYIDHRDAGWSVIDYSQHCYLAYAEGYTTELDKEGVKRYVMSIQNYVGLFGGLNSSLSNCQLFGNLGIGINYIPQNISGDHPYSTCTTPDLTRYMVGYARQDASIRYYENNLKPNYNEALIWIVQVNNYYEEDLGCGPGLFCNNPRHRPIQAQ